MVDNGDNGDGVPVLAMPIISLPHMATGTACFCMGVGSSKFCFCISFIITSSNCSCVKVFTGLSQMLSAQPFPLSITTSPSSIATSVFISITIINIITMSPADHWHHGSTHLGTSRPDTLISVPIKYPISKHKYMVMR